MNTNTENKIVNNTENNKPSRWKEIEDNFVSFVIGSVKLLVRGICILLLTAFGSYFGISYYQTEREMIDSEYYPLTSAQASRAAQLVRIASDCMRQIEAEQYDEASGSGIDLEAARDAAAEALQKMQGEAGEAIKDKNLLMFVSVLPEEGNEESASKEEAEQNNSAAKAAVEAKK